ncbi:MAG: ABC transporter substrate-binding protein [Gammaproteobacteria bacterium]|nr:ABC transporter substrate-binding protein [Gammaproteobacteria bacterium]MBT3725679.1 ABC transporter substrate-binding protein [Gammaproteobacteria bacterium]MBT4077042.1 ABC transporter substrate-binding protein [Gammaproteobacteria bacterium]MBT4195435.1 ABC transporter substrate-binding protein [Gammaproteobacteria bacterium]MBT4449458.1 ABC transporter substrate-binding protein [Gammaproteobacteria bacterium]
MLGSRLVNLQNTVLMLLLTASSVLFAGSVEQDTQRGRHIFFEGEKITGKAFTANVGAAAIPVPASALPCVGCHGRDGKGRAEGGVKPSNISWPNLSRKYGGKAESGRHYKAYDESSFLKAVTEGIDSSGNKLDTSMPRFNISRQDARDLVAYLKVILDDYDPGVSDEEIVFGTLQPETALHEKTAAAMVDVMQAQMHEINQQGGIYGRKLSLKVVPYQDRQSFIGQANQLIAEDQVFALVNSFSGGVDQSLTDMAEQGRVPSIAPFTQFPTARGGQHNYTFYLHGGLDAQVAVMARQAAEKIQSADKIYVFYQQSGNFEASAKKAVSFLSDNKIQNAQLMAYDLNTGKKFSDYIDSASSSAPFILFLGASSDLVSLIDVKTQQKNKVPYLFLPGFFVSSHILKLPTAYAGQLEMAYITVPGNSDGKALSDFRHFMKRNKLEYNNLSARLFAYSAVRTLIEGVKRSGKRISRDKLVTEIENLYGFDAGLNKPVSYGSRRRTGLLGAYVVKLDAEQRRLSPTGNWVRLD